MQPLNAIDAIAPAFTRTHQVLFQPFRAGRSWKLAASSYLGFCGSMFIPFPLFFLLIPVAGLPMRNFLLIASLIPTLIFLVILYFCARMELVVFEMVVTRAKFIAPMWRRYAARIWPWIGLKILVGLVCGALIAALFVAPIKNLFEDLMVGVASLPRGERPDPVALQALIGPFIARIIHLQLILVSMAFLLKIPSTLLNDFVLPFYVLEDIPLALAVRRGLDVVLADPVQVLFYLILKPILFFIGYIIQAIALQVAMIPFAIVFVLGAVLSGVGLHLGGGRGVGLLAAPAAVLLIVFFVAFTFYATICLMGYLLTLLEAYGIYFLGGRFRLLGDLLEPGPDKPFTPPPVFPSDEERRDDDGGPPMPMDPVVA